MEGIPWVSPCGASSLVLSHSKCSSLSHLHSFSITLGVQLSKHSKKRCMCTKYGQRHSLPGDSRWQFDLLQPSQVICGAFPSAQLRGKHGIPGVLEENGETLLGREVADFSVPPQSLALTTELVDPLALIGEAPCSWLSTTLSSSFFQWLLSCPVRLVCICAQEHDLTVGFSEMHVACTLPMPQSPPEHCVSAAHPSSTSQSLCWL